MRLIVYVVAWLAASPPTPAPPTPTPVEDEEAARVDDLLGELVVPASAQPGLVLPRMAVLGSAYPSPAEAELLALLRRDFDLSGEFQVIASSRDEELDDPLDAAYWRKQHVEVVVRVGASPEAGGRKLEARVYLPAVGDLPVWDKRLEAQASGRRLRGHRTADAILGALTGTDGPFASRLLLVRTEHGKRRLYFVDADGVGLRPVSPEQHLVIAAAFRPDGVAYWSAGVGRGRYRLYREGEADPIPVVPSGSIYGIAFAPDASQLALTIAEHARIGLFTGAVEGGEFTSAADLDFVLHPTFSPDGRLVYAAAKSKQRRIRVGKRAVSPAGVSAGAPTVCRHPEGRRLIYAVGVGKHTDLLASDLDGKNALRLTQGHGQNNYPACSPDGRLVAFFTTRRSGPGPGLYLMRVDGRRARRISAVTGDSLHWVRLPVGPEPGPEPATDAGTDADPGPGAPSAGADRPAP